MQRVLPLQWCIVHATIARVAAIRIIVPPLLRREIVPVLGRIGILRRVIRVKVVPLVAVLQTLISVCRTARGAPSGSSSVFVPMGRVERPLAGVVRVRLVGVWVVPPRVCVRRTVLLVLRHGLIDC